MLRTIAVTTAALLWFTAVTAETRRDLGSHVHGESALNIAVEGKIVAMELESPGADIVGFEHPATSAEDKSAVAKALSVLQNGGALFVMSPEAECELEHAEARVSTGVDGHDHGDHGDDKGENHNEFVAHYQFGCADPGQIRSLRFHFFSEFPDAQELKIQLAASTGAFAFDVTRDQEVLELPQLE